MGIQVINIFDPSGGSFVPELIHGKSIGESVT